MRLVTERRCARDYRSPTAMLHILGGHLLIDAVPCCVDEDRIVPCLVGGASGEGQRLRSVGRGERWRSLGDHRDRVEQSAKEFGARTLNALDGRTGRLGIESQDPKVGTIIKSLFPVCSALSRRVQTR